MEEKKVYPSKSINYYQKNPKIRERALEKITCPVCERVFTRSSKSRHDTSDYHQFASKYKK